MNRLPQGILIFSTLLGSWLGMQAVHESGHVVAARFSGGRVAKVVLHPLTISRTDLAENPRPLLVSWAGPVIGVLLPLALWGIATMVWSPGAFVFRFFAGFCLLANGAYLAFGSFGHIGDCGDILRHGSPMWLLWLFGTITMPAGLALWYGIGPQFGLGAARGKVHPAVAYVALAIFAALVVLALTVDGN